METMHAAGRRNLPPVPRSTAEPAGQPAPDALRTPEAPPESVPDRPAADGARDLPQRPSGRRRAAETALEDAVTARQEPVVDEVLEDAPEAAEVRVDEAADETADADADQPPTDAEAEAPLTADGPTTDQGDVAAGADDEAAHDEPAHDEATDLVGDLEADVSPSAQDDDLADDEGPAGETGDDSAGTEASAGTGDAQQPDGPAEDGERSEPHLRAVTDPDDPAQHFVARLRAAAADFAAAAGAQSAIVPEAVPPARHRRARCRLVLRYADGGEADLTFLGAVGRPGTPAWVDFDVQIQRWLTTGQHREDAWLVEDAEASDGVAVDVPAWLSAG